MSRPGILWDLPTRLFHWTVVVLVALSWWTAENDHMVWHYRSGYALLTLVLFRILWGFMGSSTARFRQFLRGPTAVLHYTRGLFSRQPADYVGHNPLGGWSVLALLGVLLVQITLGLFAEGVDGLVYGPFSYLVDFQTGRFASETHESLFDILLILIVLHIVVVLFYWFYKKDNLIAPMITGQKVLPPDARITLRPFWLATLILAVIGTGVWFLISQFGAKIF